MNEKLVWLMEMIESRMINSVMTLDVINDYNEEQQVMLADFLETIFDFDNDCLDDHDVCGLLGSCKVKDTCGREKCLYHRCIGKINDF